MWTDYDIKFYVSMANKAGAFSWMAKRTEYMYTRRRFALHIIGIIIGAVAALWNILTGIFTNNPSLTTITMIVSAIISMGGYLFNNVDKVLGYDEQILTFHSIMENNQLLYWEIYRTLQRIGQPDEPDKDSFRTLIDNKEKEIVKNYKPFPDSVIADYYKKFSDDAIDYNVLFNEKIDPKILVEQIQSQASIQINVKDPKESPPEETDPEISSTPLAPSGARRPREIHVDEEGDKLSEGEVTVEMTEESPREQTMFSSPKRPKVMAVRTIIPVSEKGKEKRQNLTKKQQYELDKYLLNFG